MAKKTAGQRLGEWLAASDMTQVQLAEAMDVTQPSVSKWIRGKERPRREHAVILERLAQIAVKDWGKAA